MMGSISRKMRKVSKDGFIHEGYDLSPWHRGQHMINIRNRNHYHIRIHNKGFKNKYASRVWLDTGRNTGCGFRTPYRRFKY